MADITQILNHSDAAMNRRLEQWRNKPKMEGFLSSLLGGIQELENTFFDLRNKRLDLALAEGAQLDAYGTIVGQPRLGFDDEFYRILLIARIGINVSNGEAERVISIFKLLTKANFVHYMNMRAAELNLGSDGVINPLTVDFLMGNLQRAVMGGVRLAYISFYDPVEPFSFAGPNTKTIGLGFGDSADLAVGGKFGQLYTIKRFFSFDGNNTSDHGFGTKFDPLVGGVMIGA